jgi:murein DD-endopeptidase MepM/ murein hydrolase activator NlpD
MVRVLLPLLLLVAACGGSGTSAAPEPSPTPSPTVTVSPTPSPSQAPSRKAAPTPTPAVPVVTDQPDPRWRFYTDDTAGHTAPWFAGAHRVMIGFGCNASPWYDHDSRCPGREGFHHGIDVTMPCGTALTSDVAGVVLAPGAPGSPGPAYGVNPFRIHAGDVDILIGHTRQVFVHSGQQVRPGQRIALSSDSGAPDGCHLHFEVRRHGQGLDGAIDPARWLQLTPPLR